jgi:hypothetical protein
VEDPDVIAAARIDQGQAIEQRGEELGRLGSGKRSRGMEKRQWTAQALWGATADVESGGELKFLAGGEFGC